jgi:hypothetical protein
VEETSSLPKAFGSTAVTEDRDYNSNVELKSNIIVIDDSDDEDDDNFASNLAGGKSLKTGQTSASESRARPQPVAGSSSGYLATMQQQNWGVAQSSKHGDGFKGQYAESKQHISTMLSPAADGTAVRRMEQFLSVKSPVLSPSSNIRRSDSTNRESTADQEVNDGYLAEQSRCLCINCENDSSVSLINCVKRMQPLPTSCCSGLPALRTRSRELPSQPPDRSASLESVLISNASVQLNRTGSVDSAECQEQRAKKAKLDVELAVASALHANAVSCVRDSEMSAVSSTRLTEMFVDQSPTPIDYDAISSISITTNLARDRQMAAEENTTFKRKRTADMSEKQPERHKKHFSDVAPMLYTGKQFMRVGTSNIRSADFGCTSQCNIVIDTVKSEEVATGNSTSTTQKCFMPLKAEADDSMFRVSNTIDKGASLIHPILTPLKSEKDSSALLNVNTNKRAPEKLLYYTLPVVNEPSVVSSPQKRNEFSLSKVLPVEASKLNKARKKGRFTRSQVSNSCLHSDISVTGNLLDGRQKTKPSIQSAKSIGCESQTNKKSSRNIACYSSSLMADSNKRIVKKSGVGKAGKKRKRFDSSEVDINNVKHPVSEKGQLTAMLGTNISIQPRVVLERVNAESLQKCKVSILPLKIRFKQSQSRSDAPKLTTEISPDNSLQSTSNGVKVCAVTEPCLSVDGSSSMSLPIGKSPLLKLKNNVKICDSASNNGVDGAVMHLSNTDTIITDDKSERGNDQQMLAQFPMCQEQQLDVNSPTDSDVNTPRCNVDSFHRNIMINSTCGNFNLQYMDIVLPPLICILECPDALGSSPDRSTHIAETCTDDASNSCLNATNENCEECVTGRFANASDMAPVKIGKANTREDNISVDAMSTVSNNDIVTIPAANDDEVLIENEESRIGSVTETIMAEMADLLRANKCLQVTVASNEQCTSQVTVASNEQCTSQVTVASNEQCTSQVTVASNEQCTSQVTVASNEQCTSQVTVASNEQCTSQVTVASNEQCTSQVTVASNEQCTSQVTVASNEQCTSQVTVASNEQCTSQVTVASKEQCTSQVTVAKLETLSSVEMVKSDYQTTTMSSKHLVATDTWPQVMTTVCTAVEITKMVENDKPLNDHPKPVQPVKKRKVLLSQLWDLQDNRSKPVDVNSTNCGSSAEACESHDIATTVIETPDRENMQTSQQTEITSSYNLPITSSTNSDQTDVKFTIIKNHDISGGSNNEQEHVTCLADKSPVTAEHTYSDMVHTDSAEIVTTITEENKCDGYFEAIFHEKINNTCELVTNNVPVDTGGREVVCPAVHTVSESDTAMRARVRASSKSDKDIIITVQTLSETDRDMHTAVQIVTEKDQGDGFQLSTRRTGPELFRRLSLSADADVILNKAMDNYCFVASEETLDAMAPSNNVSDSVTIGCAGAVDVSLITEAIENDSSITSVHLTRANLTDSVVVPAAVGLETCSSGETNECDELVCKTEISSLTEASCSQIVLENVDMIDLTGYESEEGGDTSERATEILEEKYKIVEGNEFVEEKTEIDEENEAVDEESEIIEIDSDADEEILEVDNEEAEMDEGGSSGSVDEEDAELVEEGRDALQLESNNASDGGASALVTNSDVTTNGNNRSQTMVHKLVEALVEASEEDILLSLQQACEKLCARASGEAHGLQKHVPFSDMCSALTGKDTVGESRQSHCVQDELPLECFATTLNIDDVSAPATQGIDTASVTASDSVCTMEIGNGNVCPVEAEREECFSSSLLTEKRTTNLENEEDPGLVNDTNVAESVACGDSTHVTEEIEYSESREVVGVSEIMKESMELHDKEYLITSDLFDSVDFDLDYESLCNDNIVSPVLRDKDKTCNNSGLPSQSSFSDVLEAVQAKDYNLDISPLLSQDNYSQLISDDQCRITASDREDSCMPENNSSAKSVESCLVEANDTNCQDSVSFHRTVDPGLASTGNSLLTSRDINEICTVLEEISTTATTIDSCVAQMANSNGEAQSEAAKAQPQHSYDLQKQQCNTSSNNREVILSSTHVVPPVTAVNDYTIENKNNDVALINAEASLFPLDFRHRTLSSSTEDGELSSGDSESSSDESESSSDSDSSSDESASSSDGGLSRTCSPLLNDNPRKTTNKDHAPIKITETQLSHDLYEQALHLHERGRSTSTTSISLTTPNDRTTEINNEQLPTKAVDRKLSDDLQEQQRSTSVDSCELSSHASSPSVANDCTMESANGKMNTFIETAKALLLLSRNLLQQRHSLSTDDCELSRNARASLMVTKNYPTKIVNKGNKSFDALEMKLDEPYSPTDEMSSVYNVTSSPVTIDQTTKHEGDRFGYILPDKKNQISVKATNETESDTCLLQRKNVTSMFADIQTPPSVMSMELDINSSSSAKTLSDKLNPLSGS